MKSATRTRQLGRVRCSCFNPRAREERDCTRLEIPPAILGFNPRAREERDRKLSTELSDVIQFQSTRS